jgi:hypothetical protein
VGNRKCFACGLVNWQDAITCRRCQSVINESRQQSQVNNWGQNNHTLEPHNSMPPEHAILEIGVKTNPGEKILIGSFNHIGGKFVLTNYRMVFLSSGGSSFNATSLLGMFGIVGTLTEELVNRHQMRRNAEEITMSALANKGSWFCDLPYVSNCEVSGSIWTLPYLKISCLTFNGRLISNVIFAEGLSKKRLIQIKDQIDEAIKQSKRI